MDDSFSVNDGGLRMDVSTPDLDGEPEEKPWQEIYRDDTDMKKVRGFGEEDSAKEEVKSDL